MSQGMQIARVSEAFAFLLREVHQPIVYEDPESGATLAISTGTAAAADGLLPAFLIAAEAVWREAVGDGFGIEIVPDPDAPLSYRVVEIGAPRFSEVLLALMETCSQARRPHGILVNELAGIWEGAAERADARERDRAAARKDGQ